MTPDRLYVGKRSVDGVRSVLARQDIGIVGEDVGGVGVRSLRFHLDDGHRRITQQGSGHVEL